MSIKKLIVNVYQIGLGPVNCYVIDDDGLTLVDTGFLNSQHKIYKALAEIGKKPSDIKQIVLTHFHPDHAGSAADIQNELNIPVYIHPIDGELLSKGICLRQPMTLSPGIFPWLVFNLFMKRNKPNIKPVNPLIDIQHDQLLPILSGVKVIHTPGHSAGHVSLLLEKEKLLIAGDICGTIGGFHFSVLNEDPELAKQTLKKVCQYDFNIACFGHGKAIMEHANRKFAENFL